MTHYVVVRSDLPIGFLAAQIVHAAGESAHDTVPPNTNAVVLAVQDENTLALLERQLKERCVPHVAVREPDAPWNGALTAIGFVPVQNRDKVRPFLRNLPLLGAA